MWKRVASPSVVVTLAAFGAVAAFGAAVACSTTFEAAEPVPAPPDEAGTSEAGADVGITLTFPGATGPSYVTQGRDGEIPFQIERRPGSGAAITITTTGLPKEATADVVTIAAGETKGRILVRASTKAVQGPFTLTVDAVESGRNGATARAVRPGLIRGLPGSLDTTFGAGGIVASVFAPAGTGTLADAKENADGSILLVGQRSSPNPFTSLARLSAVGGRDGTFAGGGVTDLQSSQVLPALAVHDVASPLKGAIDVMGGGIFTISLHRFHAVGAPLAAFNGGTVQASVPSLSQATGQQIVARPDGKLLLLAKYANPAPAVFAISRWTTDGALDATYGSAGACQITTGVPVGTRARMIVRADGSARVIFSVGDTTYAVKDCTAGGVVDTSVGAAPDHAVVVGTGNLMEVAQTAAPADDFVVLSSKADGSAQWRRVSTALAADTAIGASGDVASPVPGASAMVVQGGAVMIGGAEAASFKIVRHLANGTLDTTFGQAGTLMIAVAGTNTAELSKLVAQRDGRIIAVGTQYNTADGAVARFWP